MCHLKCTVQQLIVVKLRIAADYFFKVGMLLSKETANCNDIRITMKLFGYILTIYSHLIYYCYHKTAQFLIILTYFLEQSLRFSHRAFGDGWSRHSIHWSLRIEYRFLA